VDEELIRKFKNYIKQLAQTTVSRQYSVTGRKLRKKLGLSSHGLAKLRNAVENGRIRGVKVVQTKNCLRFVIYKDYWLKEKQ